MELQCELVNEDTVIDQLKKATSQIYEIINQFQEIEKDIEGVLNRFKASALEINQFSEEDDLLDIKEISGKYIRSCRTNLKGFKELCDNLHAIEWDINDIRQKDNDFDYDTPFDDMVHRFEMELLELENEDFTYSESLNSLNVICNCLVLITEYYEGGKQKKKASAKQLYRVYVKGRSKVRVMAKNKEEAKRAFFQEVLTTDYLLVGYRRDLEKLITNNPEMIKLPGAKTLVDKPD